MRPRCDGEIAEIEGSLGTAVRGCRGETSHRGVRASLATGHPVNLVVHADNSQVNVPPAGMDEMITADCSQVTVTGYDHDMEVRVCEFHPGCKGNCPPVRGVEGVGDDITRGTGRTPDAGNKDRILFLPCHLLTCSKRTVDNGTITQTAN